MTRTIDVHEAAQLALTVEFPGLRRPQYVPLSMSAHRHWGNEPTLPALTDEQVMAAHHEACQFAAGGQMLTGWARNG